MAIIGFKAQMDRVEDNYFSTTQLLDLNDDCLVEVFQYLRLGHKLKLVGRLSQRIDGIIYRSLSLVKSLNFNTRSPPKLKPEQLEIIGRSLRSLYITGGCFRSSAVTLKFLLAICPHKSLQFLTFRYVSLTDSILECVIDIAEQLQTLDLSFCNLTDPFLGPILRNSINLKKLTLVGNPDLKFTSLKYIKSPHLELIRAEKTYLCEDEIEKFRDENTHIRVELFSHETSDQ